MSPPDVETAAKNRRTLRWLGLMAVLMFGFGFAMVPLYGLLCELTGVGSVEQRTAIATAAPTASLVTDRWVTVKLDATVHPELPWTLVPMERKVRVHPGEVRKVSFIAENRAGRTNTGQALPSIAPWQASGFFSKMECFCFTRQTLAGGETKEMPLVFSVSPDLPADIDSLTLSYSVMRVPETQAVATVQP